MLENRFKVEMMSRRNKFAQRFDSDVLHPGLNGLNIPPFNGPWSFQVLVYSGGCNGLWFNDKRLLCASRQIRESIFGGYLFGISRDVFLVSARQE